jgi:hypothetical protein
MASHHVSGPPVPPNPDLSIESLFNEVRSGPSSLRSSTLKRPSKDLLYTAIHDRIPQMAQLLTDNTEEDYRRIGLPRAWTPSSAAHSTAPISAAERGIQNKLIGVNNWIMAMQSRRLMTRTTASVHRAMLLAVVGVDYEATEKSLFTIMKTPEYYNLNPTSIFGTADSYPQSIIVPTYWVALARVIDVMDTTFIHTANPEFAWAMASRRADIEVLLGGDSTSNDWRICHCYDDDAQCNTHRCANETCDKPTFWFKAKIDRKRYILTKLSV